MIFPYTQKIPNAWIYLSRNHTYQEYPQPLVIYIYIYWLVVDLPLWKMMDFVSWDDDIPNWMEIHKIHVPNHQPVILNGDFSSSLR